MAKAIGCPSMEEWEIERDFEALCRAKAVQKDPERMKKVRALAKKRLNENKIRQEEMKLMVDLGEGKDI